MKIKLYYSLVFLALLFSAEASSEREWVLQQAAAGRITVFDRRDSVVPERLFPLSAPRRGRPFSGYFFAGPSWDLRMQWSDGFQSRMKITAADTVFNCRMKGDSKLQKIRFLQGVLNFYGGIPLDRCYLKPNLRGLDEKVYQKLDLQQYQKSGSGLFHLKIEAEEEGAAFYINGSYAGTLRRGTAWPTALFLSARGGERFIDLSKEAPSSSDSGWLSLNLEARSSGGLESRLRLEETLPIPMRTDISHGMDLRKSETCGYFYNLYRCRDLERSAFDALPMAFQFSVPARQYQRVWVLCAPLPGAEKPSFRMVVTRYAHYGRDMESMSIADADLSAPSDKIRKVGQADVKLDGKEIRVPLYLVPLPVDNGKIQDIIHSDAFSVLPFTDYLDIDFQNIDRMESARRPRMKPRPAAVAVFGVTLEAAPAEVLVLQAERGNVFLPDEKPVVPLEVRAGREGEYRLSWQIRDVDNQIVRETTRKLRLEKGAAGTSEISFAGLEVGWYQAEIAVSRNGEPPFYRHRVSAVMLPEDTRRASSESPFSTWWFGSGAHNVADGAPELVLPFLKKAGFRSVCAWIHSEEDMKKWGFTLSQIPAFGRNIFSDARIVRDDPELWKKMEGDFKAALDIYVRSFPGCRQAVLLHESYGGQYPFAPAVLFGKEPEKYAPAREKLEKARIRAVEAQCRIYRKYYPHIKLIFGNSVWAQGILASFMAHGFDASLIDNIGSEATGARKIPETLESFWGTAGSAYVLRETSRLSGADKPVTGCYEWVCRSSDPDPLQQAQFFIRDIMVAFGYRFDRISFSGAVDAGTAYNHDPGYGKLALCDRQYQPKPLLAAVAAVTRNLDQAEFLRAFPLPDPDIFIFEFRCPGGYVYALWMTGHQAECRLEFEKVPGGDFRMEDLYGRPLKCRVRRSVCHTPVTGSVRYLMTNRRLRTAEVTQIDHPASRPPEGVVLESAQLAMADVTVDSARDARFDCWKATTATQGISVGPEFPVPVKLRENAGQGPHGRGLQVTFDLASLPRDAWNHGAYTELVLKKPIEIPDKAQRIGMWVRGNGSRGRLFWEITDRLGRKYISMGDFRNGGFGLNEKYENHFAYLGWRFLTYPLSRKYAEPRDWFSYQWCGLNGLGAGAMRGPFRITRIILSTSAKLDRIFEMVPVNNQTLELGTIHFYQ